MASKVGVTREGAHCQSHLGTEVIGQNECDHCKGANILEHTVFYTMKFSLSVTFEVLGTLVARGVLSCSLAFPMRTPHTMD